MRNYMSNPSSMGKVRKREARCQHGHSLIVREPVLRERDPGSATISRDSHAFF